jgi:hypothetical protein
MAEPEINLGPLTIDEQTNDFVIEDQSGTAIMRWDESASTWTLEDNPIEGITSLSTDSASVADNDNLTERVSGESDRILGGTQWYLIDDFGDGTLTGRTDPITGKYVSPVDGAADSLYRPEWSQLGSPSVSGGVLSLSAGDSTPQGVNLSTDVSVGEWSFEFEFSSDPTASGLYYRIIRQDGNNQIRVEVFNDGNIKIQKVDGGTISTLISGTWGSDTSTHTLRATRDQRGNMELFLDGTSQGTATDSFLPSIGDLEIANLTDSAVSVDDVEVRR